MPTINKKSIRPPWLPEAKPYERIRHRNQALYNSRKWRSVSDAFKAANPVCMLCGVEPSYYTDHIVPINEGGNVWDKSNWQALCVTCNAKKTGKQRKG